MGLINTKTKLKQFLAIATHTEIESVAPYIERAEREFIIPQIGQDMYDDLDSYVQGSGSASGSGSSADDILLTKIQESVANFAYFLYFPMLEVQVGDAGVQRMESDNQKTAYQYQSNNLKNNLLTSGYETLGTTLEYLEKNKATYTQWSNNESIYKLFKYLIIHTPAIFQQYFDIKNSWDMFFSLRPVIKQVEDLHLEPVLGAAYLQELKDELEDNNVTDPDLIEMIRKATVFLTLYSAAQAKIVQIGKDGAFEARKAGLNIRKEDPADNDRLSSFIQEHQRTGDLYLKRLVDHLNNNASAIKYKTYFKSDNYKDATAVDYNTRTFDNTADGKSFTV